MDAPYQIAAPMGSAQIMGRVCAPSANGYEMVCRVCALLPTEMAYAPVPCDNKRAQFLPRIRHLSLTHGLLPLCVRSGAAQTLSLLQRVLPGYRRRTQSP
jgi:hypothetical protein